MSDTPQVLLTHYLKTLRSPTFLREYDKLARQCAGEEVDYPRYLLRLTELEMIERERRTVERRIKEASFECVGNFVFRAIQWRAIGREEEYGGEHQGRRNRG